MARFRPVLALILVLFAFVLVSCGSAEMAAKPPTYTTAQIEKIEQYISGILKARGRMEQELTTEVQNQDWSDVRSLIHGPLGQIRQDMSNLARNLAPEVQTDVGQLTRNFFEDLVNIDEAAQNQDSAVALNAYKVALEDLDQFLELVVGALENARVA